MTAQNAHPTRLTASSHQNKTDHISAGLHVPNAQQVHNSDQLCIPAKGPKANKDKHSKLARTDVRYWKKHVKKADRGDGYVSPFYSVQIAHRGKRVRFPLETANQEAAASKAQSIYLHLLANGWDETLLKYKPLSVKPVRVATVGELVQAVRDHAEIRAATLNGYCRALRFIVSQIEDIGDQPAVDSEGTPILDRKGKPVLKSRFDYKTGGRAAWVAVVHSVTLDKLTPDRIQKWKLDYVKAAGTAPDARRHAANSVNAHLRNARSLFSETALEFVKNKLLLPEPLPFSRVKLEEEGPKKYVSKIDAREILTAARAALDTSLTSARPLPTLVKGRFSAPATDPEKLSPEQFKILCLCLLCGLRKLEADTLLWRQVDFSKGTIEITTTEYFQPKTKDSHAAIDLDDELLALFRGWKAQAKGEFVIESPNPPRYDAHSSNIRCQRDFQALSRWLKLQGVTAQKPIHEMRKELGAVLASEQGIYAAKTMLRHSDIRLTSRYYADKKQPIYSGLGSVLADMTKTVPFRAVEVAEIAKQKPFRRSIA